LRICAGDGLAAQELVELQKSWRAGKLPYVEDPWLIPNAEAWAPVVRQRLRGKRPGNGAQFLAAVAVLKHQKDPDLAELLLPLVEHKGYRTWALRFLAEIAEEEHRKVFERYARSEDPEMRLYARAGLARLGDRNALLAVIKSFALAPESMTRYHAKEDVLPTFDAAELIRVWRGAAPPGTPVDSAVHSFALDRLGALQEKKATL
jgi:hypothetical protein